MKGEQSGDKVNISAIVAPGEHWRTRIEGSGG